MQPSPPPSPLRAPSEHSHTSSCQWRAQGHHEDDITHYTRIREQGWEVCRGIPSQLTGQVADGQGLAHDALGKCSGYPRQLVAACNGADVAPACQAARHDTPCVICVL